MHKKVMDSGRYQREDGKIVIEAAVNSSKQLFNERDPAPFRARDLDDDFVEYIVSAVQEFPLKTEIKLRIVVLEETEHVVEKSVIREAIRAHFLYEAGLAQAKLRKRLKTGRIFFLVGLVVLFACVSIATLLGTWLAGSSLGVIIREGFVIIGWVAMWRPIEVILYDWWPVREQRLYLTKIASTNVEILCKDS